MWGSQCRCRGSGGLPISFPINQELTLPFYLLKQLEATCLLSLRGRGRGPGWRCTGQGCWQAHAVTPLQRQNLSRLGGRAAASSPL